MITKKIIKTIIVAICVLFICLGAKYFMQNAIIPDQKTDSPYTGNWISTSFEQEGNKYDCTENKLELTLMEGGIATVLADGKTYKREWEPTEDGLRIWNEQEEILFVYKDGILQGDFQEGDGYLTFFFEKQDQSSNQQ